MSLAVKEEQPYRKIDYEETTISPWQLTPDPAQPRKKYDLSRLEELMLGTKNGLISRILVEEMDYETYCNYLNNHCSDDELRQKYIERASKDPSQKQHMIVIGHLRWLSTLANGYPLVPVKVAKGLSVEERRDIQVQEDSQLPFKKWAKAESVFKHYQKKRKELLAEGKEYTISELCAFAGIGERRARGILRYCTGLDDQVKRLVKEDKLPYEKGEEISRLPKEAQLKVALNEAQELSLKALSKYITQCLLPSQETVLLQQVVGNGKNGNGKYLFVKEFCDVFAALREEIYKFYKLGEHKPENIENMVRSSGIVEHLPDLEQIVTGLKEGILAGKNRDYLSMLQRLNSGKDRKDLISLKRVISICEERGLQNPLAEMPEIKGKKQKVLLSKVIYDEENPRGELEDVGLEELGESMRTRGLLNEIYCERTKVNGSTRYKAIDGHRRVEAAIRIGIKQLDMIVLENVSPELRLRLQLVADSQTSFTSEENAEVWSNLYKIVKEKSGRQLSAAEFARRYCKSEQLVRTAILYDTVHPEVKDLCLNGGLLNYSTIIALSSLPIEEQYVSAMQLVLSPMSAKKTKKGLGSLRHTTLSISLSEKLKDGEEITEDFQTTFLDRRADLDLEATAYELVGGRVRKTIQFGMVNAIKRLDDAEPKMREALFADESLIRAYYHFSKTFEALKEFLKHKKAIPQAL